MGTGRGTLKGDYETRIHSLAAVYIAVAIWAASGYNWPGEIIAGLKELTAVVGTAVSWVVLGCTGMLAYWPTPREWKHWLLYQGRHRGPFSTAFNEGFLEENQVDGKLLRVQLGAWPRRWQDQRKACMRLLRLHDGNGAVVATHKDYLLNRDLAWMTTTMGAIGTGIGIGANGVSTGTTVHGVTAGAIGLWTWWGARQAGKKFTATLLDVASNSPRNTLHQTKTEK